MIELHIRENAQAKEGSLAVGWRAVGTRRTAADFRSISKELMNKA